MKHFWFYNRKNIYKFVQHYLLMTLEIRVNVRPGIINSFTINIHTILPNVHNSTEWMAIKKNYLTIQKHEQILNFAIFNYFFLYQNFWLNFQKQKKINLSIIEWKKLEYHRKTRVKRLKHKEERAETLGLTDYGILLTISFSISGLCSMCCCHFKRKKIFVRACLKLLKCLKHET